MLITKKSMYTGKIHTKDLDITQGQLDAWENASDDDPNRHIQDAFPHLSADEREFLLTGCTQEEWDEMWGEEDEE